MSYISTDYEFGITSELNNFELFRQHFSDETLIQSKSKTALFDYEGEKICVELKTRRNAYNKYPTTMIGINKLEYCEDKDKDFYFCFSFTDGLYYWKYDKNDLEKISYSKGGRRDRGRYEIKNYAYIPIEMLKQIETRIA
jgi:hypothetical protein